MGPQEVSETSRELKRRLDDHKRELNAVEGALTEDRAKPKVRTILNVSHVVINRKGSLRKSVW